MEHVEMIKYAAIEKMVVALAQGLRDRWFGAFADEASPKERTLRIADYEGFEAATHVAMTAICGDAPRVLAPFGIRIELNAALKEMGTTPQRLAGGNKQWFVTADEAVFDALISAYDITF